MSRAFRGYDEATIGTMTRTMQSAYLQPIRSHRINLNLRRQHRPAEFFVIHAATAPMRQREIALRGDCRTVRGQVACVEPPDRLEVETAASG
jgi:hypothetical protein